LRAFLMAPVRTWLRIYDDVLLQARRLAQPL